MKNSFLVLMLSLTSASIPRQPSRSISQTGATSSRGVPNTARGATSPITRSLTVPLSSSRSQDQVLHQILEQLENTDEFLGDAVEEIKAKIEEVGKDVKASNKDLHQTKKNTMHILRHLFPSTCDDVFRAQGKTGDRGSFSRTTSNEGAAADPRGRSASGGRPSAGSPSSGRGEGSEGRRGVGGIGGGSGGTRVGGGSGGERGVNVGGGGFRFDSLSRTDGVNNIDLSSNGVYTVFPPHAKPTQVRCEMDANGRGWTVLVARSSGEELFNRTYAEYEEGFGSPFSDYWIGNGFLHALSAWRSHELRAELEDFDGKTAWARYGSFTVAGPADKYALTIADFDKESTAGDGMKVHNGSVFTTYDKDSDNSKDGNCALLMGGGGGWWYNNCYHVLATGQYRFSKGNAFGGISWWPWRDVKQSLKSFKLLIKPVD